MYNREQTPLKQNVKPFNILEKIIFNVNEEVSTFVKCNTQDTYAYFKRQILMEERTTTRYLLYWKYASLAIPYIFAVVNLSPIINFPKCEPVQVSLLSASGPSPKQKRVEAPTVSCLNQ